MKILAISGSLRAASVNTGLLRAVARLAPAHVSVMVYPDLATLPLFNPDFEASDPAPVANLRALIINADAVIIASPEYAHGITGAMKNALDWMVGCEAFVQKPVALFNAAPRAIHAYASLREIITVMSARIIETATFTLPIVGVQLGEAGCVAHPEISVALGSSLMALCKAVAESDPESGSSVDSK